MNYNNIKLFFNWIKKMIINDAITYLKSTYKIKDIRLLDVSSQKGKDMYIWYNLGIMNAVGITDNDKYILGDDGATNRYINLMSRLKKHKKHNKNKIPRYEFHIYDLSDPKTIAYMDQVFFIPYSDNDSTYIDGERRTFNLICCQFGLEKFFKNHVSLETLIKIISMYLDQHGLFIGTILNNDILTKEFMNGNIEHKNYIIENVSNLHDSYSPYGNKIKFVELQDNNQIYQYEQYAINLQELIRLCELYQLQFIGITDFGRWYAKYDDTLSYEEQYLSFLHCSFAFVKL